MSELKRVIYYKKAIHIEGHNSTIENATKEALKLLPSVEDRKFPAGDLFTSIKCLDSNIDENDGVFLHLVKYSQDTKASLVPLNVSQDKGKILEMPPLNETSFLTNDLCVFIKNNDVFICGGVRESVAERFLKDLFEKAKLSKSVLQFALKNVANINNVELIKRHGVKTINLDVSMCLSSFNEMNYDHSNAALKLVSSLFGEDKTEKEKRKTSKQSAHLEITSGKLGKEDDPINNWVTQKAEEIAENDSLGYTMKLGNNQNISSDSLRVTKSIIVDKLGFSFNHEKVWLEMKEFYNQLDNQERMAS